MGAIDLSARIQAINRMNGVEHKPTKKTSKLKKEPKENSATNPVEAIWDEARANSTFSKEIVTLEQVYSELQALTTAVSEQTAELKKINKHINSTQKMLKKRDK